MSRLQREKPNGDRSTRKHRPPICEYTISVLCLEAPESHPDWAGKQWVRLDPTPWGLVAHNAGCHAWCVTAADWIAKQVQGREGGKWAGVVRSCREDPAPERSLTADEMAGMRRHILDGPDGPGRRRLLSVERSAMDQVVPVLPAWAQPVEGAGPEDAF